MLLRQIKTHLAWGDFVVVRLLRRWAAARVMEENPLPGMVEVAIELGELPQVSVALHSLFQLTETCLGRALQTECCCSPSIGPDERAILAMIAAAPVQGLPTAPRGMPHGLPGALSWAAIATRLALRGPLHPPPAPEVTRCPFERF